MEILDNHMNTIVIVGLISGIITIWKFVKSFWGKDKTHSIVSSSQQINIIQQNNIVLYTQNNQYSIFAVNKETLKRIAIFVAVILCCCLAYKTYKHLFLGSSQD